MANLPFTQFLQRYGITLLFSSDAGVIPGSIIEKRQQGYFSVGNLEHIFHDPPPAWDTILQPANFVYGTVQRSLSLLGKASLNEFGLGISGGLSKARSVDFYITGVQCRAFAHQSKIMLIPRLQELRQTNKKLWKLINNNYIADYTYYATEVTVEFESEGSADIKAEIENKITIDAGASVEWKSKSKLVLSHNSNIPFGFSGWVI